MTVFNTQLLRDLRGNNIPIDRRAQALRPYSNGFCPQCRGELRSPKRYIIKAQVPYGGFRLSLVYLLSGKAYPIRSCLCHMDRRTAVLKLIHRSTPVIWPIGNVLKIVELVVN
jgi:hypothetical protein